MPVAPINKTARWRYEKLRDGGIYLVSPAGDDYAKIFGKTLEDRMDRASKLVERLNK